MDKLLSVIANPNIDKETLKRSIRNLGASAEPARFWSDIANNDRYSKDHRRQVIFQLFKRFTSPGMTLLELAQILDNPKWLKDEDISIITSLTGKIPVKWTFEDTVFVLSIFADLSDGLYDHWAIYIRVSGKIEREDFVKIIFGKSVTEDVKNAKVLEFGFSPDNPTM